jgi:hypothetical protein
MQTTSQPKIPKDIEQIKKEWWTYRKTAAERLQQINLLKEQLLNCEKSLILADGLLQELNSKRPEPEHLEQLKSRLELAIMGARSISKIKIDAFTREKQSENM